MTRKYVRLRDGTVMELAPGDVVPDGASVVVPLALKDHEFADDPRDAAYEAMARDIADAWKSPPERAAPPAEAYATPEEAYEAMADHIANAWRDAR